LAGWPEMPSNKSLDRPSGADQFDPLHPRRRFSGKVFVVGATIIAAAYLVRDDFSDMGFGIAMAICGVIAIAIAAPSAFSRSWLSETMPDVAKLLDRTEAASIDEASVTKSKESDAV
jgi:hypothetical protein